MHYGRRSYKLGSGGNVIKGRCCAYTAPWQEKVLSGKNKSKVKFEILQKAACVENKWRDIERSNLSFMICKSLAMFGKVRQRKMACCVKDSQDVLQQQKVTPALLTTFMFLIPKIGQLQNKKS